MDSSTSRITITATGDEYMQDQIFKQLEKLHDVLVIEKMDLANTVVREHLLIKVNVAQGSEARFWKR